MVEFDCAECDTTLEPVTSPARPAFLDEEMTGSYPSALLRCPRCGASWEQRSSGRLAKSW